VTIPKEFSMTQPFKPYLFIAILCLLAALVVGCQDRATTTETPDSATPTVETPPVEPPVVEEAPAEDLPPVVEEPPTEEAVTDKPLPYGWRKLEPVFDLPGIRTEHFSLYSQMSTETTYDFALRIESLYDYYAERFADVYFPINFPKLAFLFGRKEDYVAAGGHPTMPGLFMGGHGDDVGARFMMQTSDANFGAISMVSCPLMYHELFHQFVALEISQAGNINRQWPTWMDEGHGSLFFNLMWTGDGWVDGCLTISYLHSAVMESPSFIPLRELVNINGAIWHRLVGEGKVWTCYMQSMSVLYYLYHGDGGAHRELIEAYVNAVSTDVNGEGTKELAERIIALEDDFLAWFNANMITPEEMWAKDEEGNPQLTPNVRVTGAKFYEAMTAMATSYLARAYGRGQRFESGEDFLAKAAAEELDLPALGEAQWLPDTLRQEMLWWHERLTEGHGAIGLELEYPSEGEPTLTVTQPKFGLELKGTFEMNATGVIESVDVEYVACPSINFIEAEAIVNAAKSESTPAASEEGTP